MVAAVCAWHEHHRAAAAEVNRRLALNEPMVLAAPALVEAYAVLTRLPPPHRLSTTDASAVLDASFLAAGKVLALDPGSYRRMLRQLAIDGIAGGQAYDAVIANCAVKGKASAILTFNARHFLSLAPAEIEIVVPGASAPLS